MSDIHGCYDDFMNMLSKIEFSPNDILVIAGDCIDRGPKNYDMLNWMLDYKDNVILLKGNHEEDFSYSISLMNTLADNYQVDISSVSDTLKIYETLNLMAIQKFDGLVYFDYERTIRELIEVYGASLQQLLRYADMINELPYFYKQEINGREFIIVHAGYIESLEDVETERDYESLDEFYVHARDDAYLYGGLRNGIVVAGHTPTVLDSEITFNNGNIYKFEDDDMNCIFYDIDCGCYLKGILDNAKLACIRLEDEKIFYV